jgi:hypothetical protein
MTDPPFHAIPVIVKDQVRLRIYEAATSKLSCRSASDRPWSWPHSS